MATDSDKALRDHLLFLLRGGGAHLGLDDFVADFPVELCGRKIDGLPYTPWRVIEHMRIAQWDILEFSRDASHKSPKFPEGYWPKPDEFGNLELWYETSERWKISLPILKTICLQRFRTATGKRFYVKRSWLLITTLIIWERWR